MIAAKKAKGDYDEADEIEPLVVGDEMRCRQIFTNLTRSVKVEFAYSLLKVAYFWLFLQ